MGSHFSERFYAPDRRLLSQWWCLTGRQQRLRYQLNMARALGIGTLVIGWAVYDTLWVSPLSSNLRITNITCIGLGFVAYGLSQVLSGRAHARRRHDGDLYGCQCLDANPSGSARTYCRDNRRRQP